MTVFLTAAIQLLLHYSTAAQLPVLGDTSGYTAGTSRVTDGGAFTYAVPLVITPGSAGLKPSISFSYSSQASNGLIGSGISLDGFSCISRAAQTRAQDGRAIGINFSATDRFALDGERLIITDETKVYGANNTEYRQEQNSMTRITYAGTSSGNEFFLVEDKSGLISEYGNTPDSRVRLQSGVVIHWLVNKITDRFGNYILFHYSQNPANGEYYPVLVEYTGNANTSVLPYASIQFEYEARADSAARYMNGQRIVSLTKRLRSIGCFYRAKQFRSYTFFYQYSPAGLSQLISFKECGKNGSCNWPTTLKWSNNDSMSFTTVLVPGLETGGGQNKLIATDIGANGVQGFVKIIPGSNLQAFLSNRDYSNLSFVSTNFNPPIPVTKKIVLGDPNGDTRQDVLVYDSITGNNLFYINTRYIGDAQITNHSVASTIPATLLAGKKIVIGHDFNFDGRTDYIIIDEVNGNNYWFFSNSTGLSAVSFVMNGALNYFTNLLTPSFFTGNWEQEITDLDGDGYTDAFFYNLSTGATSLYRNMGSNTPTFQLAGTNVVPPANLTTSGGRLYFGDHGSDGLPDLMFNVKSTGATLWWTNKGNYTYVAATATPASLASVIAGGDLLLQLDHNLDGIQDLCWINKTTGQNKWLINDGRLNFTALPNNLIPATELQGYDLQSIGNFTSRSSLDLYLYSDTRTPKTKILKGKPVANSLVTAITNGNADQVTINYDLLTNDSLNKKYDDAVYPLVDYQANQMIVKYIEHKNGTGSMNRASYNYEGLRILQNGRGYRGPSVVKETDEATGITEIRTYSNDSASYKYTSAPLINEIKKLANGTVISRKDVQRDLKSFFNNRSFFAYEKRTVTKNYELDGTLTDSVVQELEYDDFLNVAKSVTDFGGGRKDSLVNQLSNSQNRWILGRLTRSVLYRLNPGSPVVIKSSEFDYDVVNGSLIREGVQTDSSEKQRLYKYYLRDGHGNIISDSLVGWDGSAVTSRVCLTTYDINGRLPIASRNPAGQWTYFTYDSLLGHKTSVTDINGLTTIMTQDNMGRESKVTKPDGTWTKKDYRFCGSVAPCPPNGSQLIYEQYSSQAPKVSFYDIKNRIVREETIAFDGRTIYHDTRYDARGVLIEETNNYFSGQSPEITYTKSDLLGRPIKITRPGNRIDSISYSGRTTVLINAKGQKRITLTDVNGNIIRITDNAGNVVRYDFDCANQLIKTTDPFGNNIRWVYDTRSRLTSESDPDRGLTENQYNAFDEQTAIIRSGDTIRQRYEKQGRMTERTEKEGATKYFYDGQVAGKGMVDSIVAPAYKESFLRDAVGRVIAHTKVVNGKSYTYRIAYDNAGRINKTTDPDGFEKKFIYNIYGRLSEVQNGATGQYIYKLEAVDALGQAIQLVYANGVRINYTYDPQTAYLVRITAKKGAVTLQDVSVIYDAIGNVTSRRDNLLNKEEFFEFDNLNRLTKSTIAGGDTLVMAYDAIGNILYNSAVGTYSYGNVNNGPHKLTGINGNNAYCVPSLLISTVFNSFDKIQEIRRDSSRLNVQYDAGRQRIMQTLYDSSRLSRTKLYLFPEFEAEIKNGDTTYNHIVSGPDGAVASYLTKTLSSQRSWTYYHKDHLGSIVLVTGDTGNVKGRYSYNVWGKRRNADWSRGNTDTIALPSERGFTGHEHYDLFEMVDMNGRVYDPTLARFLSPDPLIQDVTNLQLLNRYSYCGNNPVSFSDPSGYSFWSKIKSVFKKVVSFVKSQLVRLVINAALNYLTGGTYGILSAALNGFGSSFLTTIFNGGSFGDAFKAGLRNGLISGLTNGLNAWATVDLPQSYLVQTISHAAIQGGANVLHGGSFFEGFKNSLVNSVSSLALSQVNENFSTTNQRFIANLIIGGTKSELTGGNFVNGAFSQSFSFLGSRLQNGEKISFLGYTVQKITDRYEGISFYETNISFGGITLPGIGVFYTKYTGDLYDPAKLNADTRMHEYGHFMQFESLRADHNAVFAHALYYWKYGIPSFLNATFGENHHTYPVEMNANTRVSGCYGSFNYPNIYPSYGQ